MRVSSEELELIGMGSEIGCIAVGKFVRERERGE